MMNSDALLESKILRADALQKSSPHLNSVLAAAKAHALFQAMWKGEGWATTKQIAEYYEVDEKLVRLVVSRHKDEFIAAGYTTPKRSELSQEAFSVKMTLNSEGRLPALFNPKSAVLLGMLLRDSAIAKAVRSGLLNMAENYKPNIEPEQKPKIDLVEIRGVADLLNSLLNVTYINPTDKQLHLVQALSTQFPTISPALDTIATALKSISVPTTQPTQPPQATTQPIEHNPYQNLYLAPAHLAKLYAERRNIALNDSPTYLGKFMNKLLQDSGLQYAKYHFGSTSKKKRKVWYPTHKGEQFSKFFEEPAQNVDKTISTLKWNPSVLDAIS